MDSNTALPPSKIQNMLSELFRIALCRNDDCNLAGSSTIRCTKQFMTTSSQLNQGAPSPALISSQKIIRDLQVREDERKEREA